MAFNSTIRRKNCKCDPLCPKYPTLGYRGYFIHHVPEELQQVLKKGAVDKANRGRINAISKKLREVQKDVNAKIEPVNEQNRKLAIGKWFLDRRTEMTGKCICGCNQKSCKNDDRYYKYSIAHVLGKAKFPSIATHSQNFVELAFWGGCHSVLDDKGYAYCKKTKPVLWEIIVRKFKILFPCIAENEIKYIPDVLMDELNK